MNAVLKNKLFLLTFLADMLSNFGDTLYYLALMSYVALLPDPKFGISIVTLSETIPYLTMMMMGAWADKTVDKQGRIMITLILRVCLYSFIGILMGFQPALWIVIIAALINVVSDLAGQYESYLFTPLSLRIVKKEDREATIAFRQGTSSALRIVFQSSGAILITILSFQQLAFVNAGTFAVSALIMLMIRPALNQLLANEPLKVSKEPAGEQQSFLASMLNSMRLTWDELQNLPILKASIFLITGVNAIFGVLTPIVVLTMKEFPDFMLGNTATTLAALSIAYLVGSILGNYLAMSVFKKTHIMTLLLQASLLPVFIFLSFFFHQIVATMFFYFLTAICAGILMPKLQTLVWNSIPEERIATAGAGIDTLATSGMVVSNLVVSALVVLLSSGQIAILFTLLSILLLSYTIKVKIKFK